MMNADMSRTSAPSSHGRDRLGELMEREVGTQMEHREHKVNS